MTWDPDARERQLLEASPDAMVVVDASGKIVMSNHQADAQFGYATEGLAGQWITSIIPAGFAEWSVADDRSHDVALRHPTGVVTERRAQRKDGSEYPIEVMLTPLQSDGAGVIIAAIRDISARRDLEDALFVEKERAQVTLNSIGDGVGCTDLQGNITFLNLVAAQLTGWSSNEALGRPMSEVIKIVNATTREPIEDLTKRVVGHHLTVHLPADSVLVRRDGSEIAIEDSTAPIYDRQGRATGAVIVFRDVSMARLMTLKMAHTAQHDFLTDLPNRMLLEDRIRQAISHAPRHTNQVAVLFLDLDGFKEINDSYGHRIGDLLLQSVAKRLVDCVRSSDTVSRQGGDEFVVLLSEADRGQDAGIVATRMLQAVAAKHVIEDHQVGVTTSIGVSVYPDDGRDAETLIKNADAAMYQAKALGTNGYRFFKPAMNVRATERQSIEESLRIALERGEFALHYQPRLDLGTGVLTGAEALLRWVHPRRGPLAPAQFVSVAEETGLMLPIGRWVLRQACLQAREWKDAGLPLSSMAVNVSAAELRDPEFLAGLVAILDETGLDGGSLELEVSETALMQHAEPAASTLSAIRDHGVHVAIDDFGTANSSLNYLRTFPIDSLKIDRSFVGQISPPGSDTSIVSAVISVARSLNLRVVAEGVETADQLTFLQEADCDEGQGFLFSRPVEAGRFAELLLSGIDFPHAA